MFLIYFELVDWFVGRLVRGLTAWFASCCVEWLVGILLNWLAVSWLIGWKVSGLVSWMTANTQSFVSVTLSLPI